MGHFAVDPPRRSQTQATGSAVFVVMSAVFACTATAYPSIGRVDTGAAEPGACICERG